MLKGIVFDYGNTLSCTASLAGSLERVLIHDRAREIGECIAEQIAGLYRPGQQDQPDWRDVWRYAFERFGATFSECVARDHLRTFVKECQPYDYTVPLLKYLNESGLKIGLLSNVTGPTEVFDHDLRAKGLSGFFHATAWSCEMGYRKPSRNAFQIIGNRLGEELRHLVMVGDSELADIEGGRLSGMTTVRVFDGDRAPISAADYVLQRNTLPEAMRDIVGLAGTAQSKRRQVDR